MGRYIVQWFYRSSYGGPWQAGETIEASEAQARAINTDSPGVLVSESGRLPFEPEPAPYQDRQQRTGRARKRG